MPAHICLRCLTRAAAPLQQRSTIQGAGNARQQFSTASASLAPLKKILSKKPQGAQRKQQTPGLARSTKVRQTRANTDPAVLKAQRKRIVLSNANALQVPGLQELSTKTATDEANENTMAYLADQSIDALRAAEAFKHTQCWQMFRRPSTLISSHTSDIAQVIQQIQTERSQHGAKKAMSTHREFVTGPQGSGKSILALQSLAMALRAGWVGIHVPESQDLTFNGTRYMPQRGPDGRVIYVQPDYTAALLSRIARSNQPVLSTLTITRSHPAIPITLPSGTTLHRLVDLGASDPSISIPILTALLSELSVPGRPPLYLSFDGAAHLLGPTRYLSRDDPRKSIHAQDFAIPRLLVSHLTRETALVNGGIVHAIDSGSNRPASKALDLLLRARAGATDVATEKAFLSPYKSFDERVPDDLLKGVNVRVMDGLDRDGVAALMEYYAASGMMRGAVDERRIGEEWTLSGGGVIGAVEASLVKLKV